jgi:hypothetical protein
MKIHLKSRRAQVGILGIVFSLVCAVIVLPGAKSAQAPFLYLLIFGGLFVGVPLAMAIGCLTGHLPVRGEKNRPR